MVFSSGNQQKYQKTCSVTEFPPGLAFPSFLTPGAAKELQRGPVTL